MTHQLPETLGDRYPALRRKPAYAALLARRAGPQPLPAWPPSAPGRLRVGFLSPNLLMGGAEAWQVMLAHALDPARFAAVGVVAVRVSADPGMTAAYDGLCPVAVGMDAAKSLAGACDVLVTWGVPNLPAILAGPPSPPKVVAVAHSSAACPWARELYAMAGGIDRWVAVSELALDAIPTASQAAAPASVIWNAVDPARLVRGRSRSEVLASWGVPDSALVAGFYGRWSAEKGPERLIGLARHLPEPWHVVAVGTDQTQGRLAEASRGVERLHWAPRDDRAGDVLRAMDVLVSFSLHESFGLSMAEAVAVDTPVMATEAGLARMVPGLCRMVPFDDDGAIAAREVQAAVWEGRLPGQMRAIAEVKRRAAVGRFRDDWEALLAEVGARRCE